MRARPSPPPLGPGVVDSRPIRFPGGGELVLSGRYDALLVEQCGTLTLADNKTTAKGDDALPAVPPAACGVRLRAGAPARRGARRSSSTRWAVGVRPSGFTRKQARMGLYGATRWVQFKREEEAFLKFLGGVASLLQAAEPMHEPCCAWCRYRSDAA